MDAVRVENVGAVVIGQLGGSGSQHQDPSFLWSKQVGELGLQFLACFQVGLELELELIGFQFGARHFRVI